MKLPRSRTASARRTVSGAALAESGPPASARQPAIDSAGLLGRIRAGLPAGAAQPGSKRRDDRTLLRDQLPRALEVLRSADVRLVTLKIGGNDVVEPVVRACALAPQTQTCGAAVVASLRNADEGIEEVLRTVRDAVGPDTPVAVMTY